MRMNKRMINIASNALSFNISFLRIKKSPYLHRMIASVLFLFSFYPRCAQYCYTAESMAFFLVPNRVHCYLIHLSASKTAPANMFWSIRTLLIFFHISECSYKEIVLNNFGSVRFIDKLYKRFQIRFSDGC